MLAADSIIADGADAVFTPSDNTIMTAELSIYEELTEAGIPHYAGSSPSTKMLLIMFAVSTPKLIQSTPYPQKAPFNAKESESETETEEESTEAQEK